MTKWQTYSPAGRVPLAMFFLLRTRRIHLMSWLHKSPNHCFFFLGVRRIHIIAVDLTKAVTYLFFFYLGARRTRLISTSGQPGAREKRPKRIKSTPAMKWIVTISEFRALRFWKCFVNLYFAPGRQLYIFSEATKRTTCHSVVMCLLAIKRLGNVIVSSVLSLWH